MDGNLYQYQRWWFIEEHNIKGERYILYVLICVYDCIPYITYTVCIYCTYLTVPSSEVLNHQNILLFTGCVHCGYTVKPMGLIA